MKIAIIVIIFIAGLIIIHLKQKISDLEDELQYLAHLIFENQPKETISYYELIEDEEGTIIDKNGKRLRMVKTKVDKEEKM